MSLIMIKVESLICPVACLGMFAWCVNYGGGLGVSDLGEARMHGGALGWGMLNGINSCLGVTSALLVNVSARRTTISDREVKSEQSLTDTSSNLI